MKTLAEEELYAQFNDIINKLFYTERIDFDMYRYYCFVMSFKWDEDQLLELLIGLQQKHGE